MNNKGHRFEGKDIQDGEHRIGKDGDKMKYDRLRYIPICEVKNGNMKSI